MPTWMQELMSNSASVDNSGDGGDAVAIKSPQDQLNSTGQYTDPVSGQTFLNPQFLTSMFGNRQGAPQYDPSNPTKFINDYINYSKSLGLVKDGTFKGTASVDPQSGLITYQTGQLNQTPVKDIAADYGGWAVLAAPVLAAASGALGAAGTAAVDGGTGAAIGGEAAGTSLGGYGGAEGMTMGGGGLGAGAGGAGTMEGLGAGAAGTGGAAAGGTAGGTAGAAGSSAGGLGSTLQQAAIKAGLGAAVSGLAGGASGGGSTSGGGGTQPGGGNGSGGTNGTGGIDLTKLAAGLASGALSEADYNKYLQAAQQSMSQQDVMNTANPGSRAAYGNLLMQSYTDPNSYLTGPENTASLSLATQLALNKAATGGRTSSDSATMDIAKMINTTNMANLGNYRQGLQAPAGTTMTANPSAYANLIGSAIKSRQQGLGNIGTAVNGNTVSTIGNALGNLSNGGTTLNGLAGDNIGSQTNPDGTITTTNGSGQTGVYPGTGTGLTNSSALNPNNGGSPDTTIPSGGDSSGIFNNGDNAFPYARGGNVKPGQLAIVGDSADGKPTGHEEGIVPDGRGGVHVIPHHQMKNMGALSQIGQPRFANGGIFDPDAVDTSQGSLPTYQNNAGYISGSWDNAGNDSSSNNNTTYPTAPDDSGLVQPWNPPQMSNDGQGQPGSNGVGVQYNNSGVSPVQSNFGTTIGQASYNGMNFTGNQGGDLGQTGNNYSQIGGSPGSNFSLNNFQNSSGQMTYLDQNGQMQLGSADYDQYGNPRNPNSVMSLANLQNLNRQRGGGGSNVNPTIPTFATGGYWNMNDDGGQDQRGFQAYNPNPWNPQTPIGGSSTYGNTPGYGSNSPSAGRDGGYNQPAAPWTPQGPSLGPQTPIGPTGNYGPASTFNVANLPSNGMTLRNINSGFGWGNINPSNQIGRPVRGYNPQANPAQAPSPFMGGNYGQTPPSVAPSYGPSNTNITGAFNSGGGYVGGQYNSQLANLGNTQYAPGQQNGGGNTQFAPTQGGTNTFNGGPFTGGSGAGDVSGGGTITPGGPSNQVVNNGGFNDGPTPPRPGVPR